MNFLVLSFFNVRSLLLNSISFTISHKCIHINNAFIIKPIIKDSIFINSNFVIMIFRPTDIIHSNYIQNWASNVTFIFIIFADTNKTQNFWITVKTISMLYVFLQYKCLDPKFVILSQPLPSSRKMRDIQLDDFHCFYSYFDNQLYGNFHYKILFFRIRVISD